MLSKIRFDLPIMLYTLFNSIFSHLFDMSVVLVRNNFGLNIDYFVKRMILLYVCPAV